MKRINKSLLGVLAAIVFTWIFLTSLVVQAPVGWLVYQAQQGKLPFAGWSLPPDALALLRSLDAQALQGRLGQGQASNLKLAGMELTQVQWQLPWWRLALGHPLLLLQVGETPMPWQLHLEGQPGGTLQLRIQAGRLDVFQGGSLALQGHLQGKVEARFQMQAGNPECLDLHGHWQGRVRLQSPMPVDLGQVHWVPSCAPATADQLRWKLTSQLAEAHQLELEGQASTHHWSFRAQAQVHNEAQLAPLLRMLGWQVQDSIREGHLAPGQHLEARGKGSF